MKTLFPNTYEESRERFLQDIEQLRPRWNSIQTQAQPLKIDPSLSIDYTWAEPQRKERLVLISTGLHGIEGYAGAAMLKIFMQEFAPRLDPQNTGLLLVHAINPWGMKHRRRYNENNVDLNRNFLWDENYDPHINPDYEPLTALLNPARPLANLAISDAAFAARLVVNILRLGILRIRQGTLSGQYRHPRGIQFGGQDCQQSTRLIRQLFQQALQEYGQVTHLDMHTGYGPRYQMSMVNSVREPAPAAELMQRFNYPLIMAATPTDFYTTTGDITEYFYQLRDEKFPDKKLFSTCFEFGTFGATLPAQIRSMRATILENRLFQFGAKTESVRQAVRKEYEELFFPAEELWRGKALEDCRQAMQGVLADFGLIEKV